MPYLHIIAFFTNIRYDIVVILMIWKVELTDILDKIYDMLWFVIFYLWYALIWHWNQKISMILSDFRLKSKKYQWYYQICVIFDDLDDIWWNGSEKAITWKYDIYLESS